MTRVRNTALSNVRVGLLTFLVLVVSTTCPDARAADETRPEGKAAKPKGIELDVKKREVRVDATACLGSGILEYVVCLPNTFEHESIFCIQCRPATLHLYLLAIGLEQCAFVKGEDWRATALKNKKSHVSIEVEYEEDGKKQRRPIGEFLINREQRDGSVEGTWVFTGSYLFEKNGKRYYAADVKGAVVGLSTENTSVLQYSEPLGLAYRGDDKGMEVDKDTIPAIGTKVQLIFSSR